MMHVSALKLHITTAALALLISLLVMTIPARADGPIDIRKYHLAPGDKVIVTVFGQPELSGDFIVDGAGNILLPLLGSIEVKDLTVLDSQDRIVKLLEDGILQKPVVTVKIAELRPIQVLGSVRTPGLYPYRFGSIVKGAIAQAGGLGLAQQYEGAAVSEMLLSDERVLLLNAERKLLLVRKSRLEAQRDKTKTFEETITERDLNDPDMSALIKQEAQLFNSEVAALEKQVTTIRSQKPQMQFESDAIDGQIASETKQIELVQGQLNEYKRLIDKGLGKSNSVIELQLGEASKQSNVYRLKADKFQLQNKILALDIQLNDIEATYINRVQTQLQDVQKRLREIDHTLPSAEQMRDFRAAVAGQKIESDNLQITITRVTDGTVASFKVDDTTFLEPGDIIDVKTAPYTRDKKAAQVAPPDKTAPAQGSQSSTAQSAQ